MFRRTVARRWAVVGWSHFALLAFCVGYEMLGTLYVYSQRLPWFRPPVFRTSTFIYEGNLVLENSIINTFRNHAITVFVRLGLDGFLRIASASLTVEQHRKLATKLVWNTINFRLIPLYYTVLYLAWLSRTSACLLGWFVSSPLEFGLFYSSLVGRCCRSICLFAWSWLTRRLASEVERLDLELICCIGRYELLIWIVW